MDVQIFFSIQGCQTWGFIPNVGDFENGLGTENFDLGTGDFIGDFSKFSGDFLGTNNEQFYTNFNSYKNITTIKVKKL